MKYVITADQKFYFDKHHSIEFENLLSDKELAILKKAPLSLRDSIRTNPEVKKIVLSSRFVQIAKELTCAKTLRFGFDQLYTLPMKGEGLKTLQEMSAISPLACGFTICLEGESERQTSPNNAPFVEPFAQKPGNVVFFKPDARWDLSSFVERQKQKFLLVAFAELVSLYVYQEQDPFTHTLKQLGYVFGDRLCEKWHPRLI